jgi:hypothetical protein
MTTIVLTDILQKIYKNLGSIAQEFALAWRIIKKAGRVPIG